MEETAEQTPATAAVVRPLVTRRRVLGSGLVVLAAAGAGVAVGGLQPLDSSADGQPPAELMAAVAAETALIAGVDAALAGNRVEPALRPLLTAVRADHVAHRQALRALAAEFAAAPATTAMPTPTPAGAPDVPRVRAAEQRAATAAARRADQLAGRTAVVLASIAACEASHAELLG